MRSASASWWPAFLLGALGGSLGALDLRDLPQMPVPRADIVVATPEPQWLGRGVGVIRDQAVVLDGTRWIDSGPEEGLAILACLSSGRLHESLVRLVSDDAALLKSAFILAFGWADGATNDPLRGLPPRGVPVRVEWEWHDEEGATRRIDITCLVRDRTTDRAFPPLPLIYTGSRLGEQRLRTPDGKERMVPSFKLAEHRSLAALFDEHDALLSTPLAFLDNDIDLEVNTRLAPPGRTSGRLIVRPAELLLTLWADEAGNLRAAAEGSALDDDDLTALLRKHYRPDGTNPMCAVAIRPPPVRAGDRALADRLFRCAVGAGCWVLPVFLSDSTSAR